MNTNIEEILNIDGGDWRCVLGADGGFIAGLGDAAYAALASNPVGCAVGGTTNAAKFC